MGLICNKAVKLCAFCKHKETCREDLKHETQTLESISGRFFVDGKEVSASRFKEYLEAMRER